MVEPKKPDPPKPKKDFKKYLLIFLLAPKGGFIFAPVLLTKFAAKMGIEITKELLVEQAIMGSFAVVLALTSRRLYHIH